MNEHVASAYWNWLTELGDADNGGEAVILVFSADPGYVKTFNDTIKKMVPEETRAKLTVQLVKQFADQEFDQKVLLD